MTNLVFDVDDTVVETDSGGVTIEYKGVLSLEYSYSVLVSNISQVVSSLLTKGSYVRIYQGTGNAREFLVEGTVTRLYTYINRTVRYTSIDVQNYGFVRLSEVEYTGEISGELSGIVKQVSGSRVMKRYSGTEIIYRFASGRAFDIIKDIVHDKGKVWNVKSDVIWIGDTLSDKVYDVSPSNIHMYPGKLRDDNGNVIKSTDAQLTKFSPNMKPGDRIRIRDRVYTIVLVTHRYVDTDRTSLKATFIKMVTVIGEAYKIVDYYDKERRIAEISDYRSPVDLYDPEYNEHAYYDHDRMKNVADLQEKSFVLHTVAGATYLDYIGGISTSATVGVYIPYDVVVVGVGVFCDGTDDAVVHVRRNGVDVSLVSIADRIPKYEKKNDIFGMDGLMSVYVSIGGGFIGVNYMIVNVYYRRICKYE